MAAERGITINGRAISDSDPRLPQHYLQNLVTGPASFVMEVRSVKGFPEAIIAKLLRVIAALMLADAALRADGWALP